MKRQVSPTRNIMFASKILNCKSGCWEHPGKFSALRILKFNLMKVKKEIKKKKEYTQCEQLQQLVTLETFKIAYILHCLQMSTVCT